MTSEFTLSQEIFLRLKGNALDGGCLEYYVKDVGKILGILSSLLKRGAA
jgi:hypothetical protein